MSIVGIWVAKTGRDGSGDSQYTRTYTLPLLVRVDDPNDDALAIRNYVATVYPLGSGYGPDPGAVVQGYRETQSEDWQIWNVDVLYSSKIDIRAAFGSSGGQGGSGGGGSQNADPLLRSPELSFSTETYQEAIDKDFRNFAQNGGLGPAQTLCNSANDPFLPPVTIERRRLVLTLKINKLTYDPFIFSSLLDNPTTNQELFLDFFTARTVHYCEHHADSLQEHGIWYWSLTHKFRINTDRWNPTFILDQGFRLQTAEAGYVPIRSDDGQPISSPALLDGSGGLANRDADGKPIVVQLGFYLFKEADYQVFT